jgi:uncharacterized LabA/DUF88 family protein
VGARRPSGRRSTFWTCSLKTNVYIDGFNLFYGRLKGTPFKWLDLQSFCELALPRLEINRVLYFTALVHPRAHNPEQPLKQATYLRALATRPKIDVHFGSFLTSVIRQPIVELDLQTGRWTHVQGQRPRLQTNENGEVLHAAVLKTEEKGSDVNLASHLLKDAFTRDCECAVVISNDSDLLTPMKMARDYCGLKVGLLLPRPKGSHELRSIANFSFPIREHLLSRSQLPPLLHDYHGPIHKPLDW